MVRQEPQRPADAYHEIARILGDKWFLRPIPPRGIEVVVIGVDQVATRWAVDDVTAAELHEHVKNNPHLRWHSHRRYTRQGEHP